MAKITFTIEADNRSELKGALEELGKKLSSSSEDRQNLKNHDEDQGNLSGFQLLMLYNMLDTLFDKNKDCQKCHHPADKEHSPFSDPKTDFEKILNDAEKRIKEEDSEKKESTSKRKTTRKNQEGEGHKTCAWK